MLTLMSRVLNIIIRFIINKLAFQLTHFCLSLGIQCSYKSGKRNAEFNLSFVIIRPEGLKHYSLLNFPFTILFSVFI